MTFIRSRACVFKKCTSEQALSGADCLKLSPVSPCRLSSQTRSCNPSLVIAAVPLKISFSFFLDGGGVAPASCCCYCSEKFHLEKSAGEGSEAAIGGCDVNHTRSRKSFPETLYHDPSPLIISRAEQWIYVGSQML